MGSSYPFGKSIHAHGSRQNLAIARESHLQEIHRPGSDRSYPASIHPSLATHDDHDTSGDAPNSRPGSTISIPVNIRRATPPPGSPPGSPDPANTFDQGRLSANVPARSTSPEHTPSHDDVRPSTPTRTTHAHFVDLPTRSASPASSGRRSQSRLSRPATPAHFIGSVPPRVASPSPSVAALRSANIFPTAPEAFSRYQTRDIVTRPTEDPGPLNIPPLMTDFRRHVQVCTSSNDELTLSTAKLPESLGGSLLFIQRDSHILSTNLRVYTDSNLFDDIIRRRVERDVLDIQAQIPASMHGMGWSYDLAMETYFENGNWQTAYYLADHTKQTIFFVDVYNARSIPIIGGLEGVQELRHVQFELTAQYWHHVQLYPTCRLITHKDLCELRDEVMHNIGDIMTSPYSTSPYALKELYDILSLLTPLEKNLNTSSPGSLTLVARFKTVFARGKFLNWHGLTCARLERTASVYGDRPKTTWLLRGISLLLFSAPDVVHRWLQKILTDELLYKAVFEETIAKLNGEWQELILFATVMLATNVGFLSIESVDKGGGNSAAQIASYVSTLTSIGSVVLGLLLARQTKTKNRECADQMQGFLKRKYHKVLGLEILAILYSLPYALIMWSVISFLAALFLCVVLVVGARSRIIFLVCMVFIVVSFLWCIGMGWEKQPPPEDRLNVPSGADAIPIRSMPPSTSTILHTLTGNITPSDTRTGSRTFFLGPDPIAGETTWGRFLNAIGRRRSAAQDSTPVRQRFRLRRRRASTLGEVVIEPPPDGDV